MMTNKQRAKRDAAALAKQLAAQAPPTMSDFDATMIAEGVQDATQEEQVRAWQHLIDTGLAWSLQGFFGRTAMSLIEQGVCHR